MYAARHQPDFPDAGCVVNYYNNITIQDLVTLFHYEK
jgi:hypothetical protein